MKRIVTLIVILSLLTGCGRVNSSASVNNAIDDNYRNYYEVFVYSFCDSDGDGIGDLKGVEERLDYITELSCNGIWLMPVMPSPTYHKYDVTDYKDIDPQYGSMEDFESLIKTAHDRHVRVIIDMVINHTSSAHPWFTAATDYLKGLPEGAKPDTSVCPYIDYYHFGNEQKDGTWYSVPGTQYFYEGSFWSEMPDLNLENEALVAELESVADYWIEKGVDGFRMDAPLHYEENDTEFNTAVLKRLYDHCLSKNADFYMVSEIWAGEKTIEKYYESETPSMFDFTFAQAEGDIVKAARGTEKAQKFVERMIEADEERRAINPEYINAPFITNHDMARVSNALNGKPEDMKMAAALLLSMEGSPFIYYGEEIGLSSKGTKDENKRVAMYWSDTKPDGMCDGPVDADKDIEQKCAPADEQIKDRKSLYSWYKYGLTLRNTYPEIARGTSFVVKELTDGHVAAVKRTYDDNTIYIVYNTGKEEAKISLIGTETAECKVAGCMSAGEGSCVIADGALTLPAKTVVYLK